MKTTNYLKSLMICASGLALPSAARQKSNLSNFNGLGMSPSHNVRRNVGRF